MMITFTRESFGTVAPGAEPEASRHFLVMS
jgi:hypothetical protein